MKFDVKKFLILNFPYVFMFWFFDKVGEGYRLAASSYTIVDMEQDGTFEAVLLLTLNAGTDYGRLVLRQDGSGTVYGYTLGSRELMDLKADGTYSYSYGASSNGFGQMIFSDTDISGTICHDWATVPISCMDTVTDADGTTHTDYYWGSQPISQGVYEDTLAAQQSKEDVSWQSLPGRQTNPTGGPLARPSVMSAEIVPPRRKPGRESPPPYPATARPDPF